MNWSSLTLSDNSFSIPVLGISTLLILIHWWFVFAAEGPHLRTAQNLLESIQTPRDRQKRHPYQPNTHAPWQVRAKLLLA